MTAPLDYSSAWHDLEELRAVIRAGEEDAIRRRLIGRFDRENAAHVHTLLALAPEDRRMLFERGTWANWGEHGLNHAVDQLARTWTVTGRFSEALGLLDDLVTVRYLDAQTYNLALWAVLDDNSKLGVQPARARAYLVAALHHGRRLPAIYHNAMVVYAELGDREGALDALAHAARYGYDLNVIAAEPLLASLLGEPAFAEIMQLDAAERSTILLRQRLAALDRGGVIVHHTPRRVAARALVLAAVAWRAALPALRPLLFTKDRADAMRDVAEMRRWLKTNGLDDELDDAERSLFDEPLHSGMTAACVDHSWAIETGAMLGWALRRVRQPQALGKVDPDATRQRLGLGTPEGEALLSHAELRAASEIHQQHRRWLDAHWRLQVQTGAKDRAISLALERYRATAWLVAPSGARMAQVVTTV